MIETVFSRKLFLQLDHLREKATHFAVILPAIQSAVIDSTTAEMCTELGLSFADADAEQVDWVVSVPTAMRYEYGALQSVRVSLRRWEEF